MLNCIMKGRSIELFTFHQFPFNFQEFLSIISIILINLFVTFQIEIRTIVAIFVSDNESEC